MSIQNMISESLRSISTERQQINFARRAKLEWAEYVQYNKECIEDMMRTKSFMAILHKTDWHLSQFLQFAQKRAEARDDEIRQGYLELMLREKANFLQGYRRSYMTEFRQYLYNIDGTPQDFGINLCCNWLP